MNKKNPKQLNRTGIKQAAQYRNAHIINTNGPEARQIA